MTVANTNEAKSDPKQQLQTLREQAEVLVLESQVHALSTRLRHADMQDQSIVESAYSDSSSWGLPIDPSEMFQYGDFTAAAGMGERADALRNGDFAPHFTNEQQLADIRGAGCFIAETDPAGINIVQTLVSYAIGTGMSHEIQPKPEAGPAGEQAAIESQAVVDEFLDRVNWLNSLDAELFAETRKAGERFIHLKDIGGGYADIEVCEPSWITEPQNARQIEDHHGLPSLDWKYGVATYHNRPKQVVGYFCCRYGDANDWDFIPVEEMLHVKVNSKGKRGLSDFYGGSGEWLKEARKTLRNIVVGGGVQAAVSFIRTHAKGSSNGQVRSAVDSVVEFNSTLPPLYGSSTPRSVGTERYYPGKILDERGFETKYGAMGTPVGPQLIGVVDAGLRFAGRRWGLPEDMVSGNASANNFASILEAHTPFTIQMKRTQGQEANADKRMLWKVLDNACRVGRLPYSPQQLRQLVTVDVKPSDIETRDQQVDHTIRKEQHEAKILSGRTWAEMEGYDYDKEQENLESEKPLEPPMIMGPDGVLTPNPMAGQQQQTQPGQPGQPPQNPGQQPPIQPTQPAIESESEQRIATLADRALAKLME